MAHPNAPTMAKNALAAHPGESSHIPAILKLVDC